MSWSEILDRLRVLAVNDPEWERVEQFVVQLQELLALRQSRLSAYQQLESNLGLLHTEYANELVYLERAEPGQWLASHCEATQLEAAARQLGRFLIQLGELRTLRVTPAATRRDEAQRQRQLEELLHRLDAAVCELDPLFAGGAEGALERGPSGEVPAVEQPDRGVPATAREGAAAAAETPPASVPGSGGAAPTDSLAAEQIAQGANWEHAASVAQPAVVVGEPSSTSPVLVDTAIDAVPPAAGEAASEGQPGLPGVAVDSAQTAVAAPDEEAAPPSEVTAGEIGWEGSSRQIAERLTSLSRVDQYRATPMLVWHLVGEGRSGLAYWLTFDLELHGEDVGWALPSWLVRAAALSPHLYAETGELAPLLVEELGQFTPDWLENVPTCWRPAVDLLVAAVLLPPALLVPAVNAGTKLALPQLGHVLPRFASLCECVARFARYNQPVLPLLSTQGRDAAEQAKKIESLRSRVRDWYQRAGYRTMRYALATNVWRAWLQADGIVYRLLSPVLEGNSNDWLQVQRAASEIRDRRKLDQCIRRTVGEIGGRDEIVAAARVQLHKLASEAAELADEWLKLAGDAVPPKDGDFLQQQAEQLCKEVLEALSEVREEFERLRAESVSPLLQAIDYAARVLDRVHALFSGRGESAIEAVARHCLSGELLAIEGLELDEQWEPEQSQPLVGSLLAWLAVGGDSWNEAFACRLARHDFQGAHRILEFLAAHPRPTAPVENLRRKYQSAWRDYEEQQRQNIAEARRELEVAVIRGVLREVERTELAAQLDEAERQLSPRLRLAEQKQRLQAVRQEIAERYQQQTAEIEDRLARCPGAAEHRDYECVRRAIEQRDLLTAREYLVLVERGERVPPPSPRRDWLAEFLDRHEEIRLFLEQHNLRDLAQTLRDGSALGPLAIDELGENQRSTGVELLRLWFAAKLARQISHEQVEHLLKLLGVTEPRACRDSARTAWFDVEAMPLEDRHICPIPAFGSQAKGRYRVLCLWDAVSEEDLLQEIGTPAYEAPILLCYFQRMSLARRRNLASLCRERRRGFLVLDEVLLVYLCSMAGSRLPVFFHCALPFSFQEPYSTTAGLVPPEMFYGRQHDLDSIAQPHGTCFIYGGRQLGKTALLRHAQRRLHAPREGKVVIWLDLKSAEIGTRRALDELWLELAEQCRAHGVPISSAGKMTQERILGEINAWLQADDRRRLWLLLDEVDLFLQAEGNEPPPATFARVQALKGLMDRTDRRFKVVFAGLHDVQRASRLANQPLAPGHFGDPLCVGPLINNGEARAARELITDPLAALGYRFASDDLVMRILAFTNYYPHLIQLFCVHLLRYLQGTHVERFNARSAPPFIITSQHLDDVMRSQDLREQVKDRFVRTLDLDKRYHLIALVLALHARQAAQQQLPLDLPITALRQQVQHYWPAGFAQHAADEVLSILLDEMVGLGVVVRCREGGYALRGTNVAQLLGDREELERGLLAFDAVQPPEPYQPEIFRGVMHRPDGTPDRTRRRPLTALQESRLLALANGVNVVFGTAAAGLGDLPAILLREVGESRFVVWDSISGPAELLQRLQELRLRRSEGHSLALIPGTVPWTPQWIREALVAFQRYYAADRFTRLVFVADPPKAWDILARHKHDWTTALDQGAEPICLAPWHDRVLDEWLDDCEFGSAAKLECADIAETTGNWPLLLAEFLRLSGPACAQWEEALKQLESMLSTPPTNASWLQAWGLADHPKLPMLRDWAEVEEISVSDLAVLAAVDELSASLVLRWAEMLGMAVCANKETWRLNRAVARCLTSIALAK